MGLWLVALYLWARIPYLLVSEFQKDTAVSSDKRIMKDIWEKYCTILVRPYWLMPCIWNDSQKLIYRQSSLLTWISSQFMKTPAPEE